MTPEQSATATATAVSALASRFMLDGATYADAAPLGVAGMDFSIAGRALPEPEDTRALAMHRLDALRELRGALHGAAVVAGELTPREALQFRPPHMVELFGWSEPHPDVTDRQSSWEAGEAATDRAFGRALAVLDEHDRSELSELVNAAHVATA